MRRNEKAAPGPSNTANRWVWPRPRRGLKRTGLRFLVRHQQALADDLEQRLEQWSSSTSHRLTTEAEREVQAVNVRL